MDRLLDVLPKNLRRVVAAALLGVGLVAGADSRIRSVAETTAEAKVAPLNVDRAVISEQLKEILRRLERIERKVDR